MAQRQIQQNNENPPPNVTIRRMRRTPRTDLSLFQLIMDRRSDEAIEVVKSGNYNPISRDGNDNTYLMLACQNEMIDVALELIDRDNSNPEAINYSGDTALTIACKKGLIEVALSLIQTGESCPECKNDDGETALLLAVKNPDPTIDVLVVELLNTGKSLPHTKDMDGYSALSNAISNGNIHSAIEILKYDPTTANSVNNEGETPLIIATDVNIPEVASLLIKTGKSHPEYIDDNYNTALMIACRNRMIKVALDIIKTGKCNKFIRNDSGKTALDYAREAGLSEVVNAIKALGKSDIEINLNANGFDAEQQEDIQIKKYLDENKENMCFKFENSYFLTNKTVVKNQLSMPQNIKYICRQAGNNVYDENDNLTSQDYTHDENILYSKKYFSLSSLTGLQILVLVDEIDDIINNYNSSNIYYLSIASSTPSIISEAYIKGISGVGADHCQTGKSTDIYTIIKGIPVNGPVEKLEKKVISVSNNTINIQYKTNTITLPIQSEQTIGQLKEQLLQKLVEQNLLDNVNKSVKLIYKGKIYGNDKNADLLTSMPDFAPGQTLSAMIAATNGGKRHTKKHKKYIKKRYTKKHYIKK